MSGENNLCKIGTGFLEYSIRFPRRKLGSTLGGPVVIVETMRILYAWHNFPCRELIVTGPWASSVCFLRKIFE
jgi:hypothetical protein